MPRIHQLSPQVINKIAAGEVIERPASVVKELLENALDALATRIELDVENGGADLIRVTDNGCGIEPEDLPRALDPHATSKLDSAEDLFRVLTMGFRGEALASIAEVSRVSIRSRPPEAAAASEIISDAGRRSEIRTAAGPAGTRIEVRDLFCSVPVRRKFLKRASTEFGHIAEQFTRIALANPRLHLTVRHNGKVVHDLPPVDRLSERLSLFFGREKGDDLIWVENSFGEGAEAVRLWGYVAPPTVSHNTRKQQYMFLNGRWFNDRSLQHALGEAYRGLLMVGRHPVAFLFVEMPASMVDVNVHPTKNEVRFVDSSSVYRLLLSTLRSKFLTLDLPTRLDPDGLKPNVTPEKQLEMRADFANWAKQAIATAPVPQPAPVADRTPFDSAIEPTPTGGEDHSPSQDVADTDDQSVAVHSDPLASIPAPESITPPPPASFEPDAFRALQVHDTYLVVETGEGITVIDQHALHERVMYETLRRRVLNGEVEVQRLLIPATVELSPKEAALIEDHEEMLRELGLEVEPFGSGTVLLAAMPVMLSKAEPAAMLQEVAKLLEASDRKAERRDLIDTLLHMMSCKAAIKAGQKLSRPEIDALLSQRNLIDDAHHCPHGRPTALTLSRDELDRQFGRLGA